MKRFPCLEQPAKCILSCDYAGTEQRIAARRNGTLSLTSKRTTNAEFLTLPCERGVMMFKSAHRENGYLRFDSSQEASIVASPLEEGVDLASYQWRLTRTSTGRFSIMSAVSEGCSLTFKNGGVCLEEGSETTWSLEFLSGELLFLCSEVGQIRCDVFGMLSVTDNCKGWEVWRFIEAGDSRVRIHSWMHNRYLSVCETDGTVTTTAEPGTAWEVEAAPAGGGVILRASETGSLLCCSKENDRLQLRTTDDVRGVGTVWQLEAAHQQTYTFHCSDDSRSLGPFPWVTDNHKQIDQFHIETTADNAVTLLAVRTNQYVGIVEGKVALQDARCDWIMKINADGTYQFQTEDESFLSVLKHETETQAGPGELHLSEAPSSWRLEPVMPRAVSSSKIRTFAAGTTLAVATTVAMPFAVAGVVGLIGTEMGILANAVAVTLTGAEALASVGVIGATAAICFRQSPDTLSASLEDQTEEGLRRYSKRPFCDWRSW